VDSLYQSLLKNLGLAGAIWILWYFYHQAAIKILQQQMANQKAAFESTFRVIEQQIVNQKDLFENMLREQRERESQTFTILKEQIETLQYHTGILSRMEQKIDGNQFCPIVKEKTNR
jgi:hypothetical protein